MEHGVDAEDLLEVAAGRATSDNGYECGETCEYQPASGRSWKQQRKAKAPTCALGDEDKDGGGDEDGKEDDEPADLKLQGIEPAQEACQPSVTVGAPAAPPVNKMVVGLVAPMVATQLLKLIDQKAPTYVPRLRAVYFAVLLLHVITYFLLNWCIKARDDLTLVELKENSLASAFGKAGAAVPPALSCAAYDAEQLQKIRSSYQFGLLITLFMHFKMRMNQPLVYSSISNLVDLYYQPLVQIHLLRRTAIGALRRPFGVGGELAGLAGRSAGGRRPEWRARTRIATPSGE
jgi:hypothetical protein